MRYEGYDSDTSVATRSRRRRRSRQVCRSFTCISPWFIFRRWFNGGKASVPGNRFAERNWSEEKKEEDLDAKRKRGIVPFSSRRIISAESGKEASFNLGVGLGLIYLVRNELNKMVELRKRIELLLQNFHAEIEDQDRKQHYIPSISSTSASLSGTRVQETLYDEEHDQDQCVSPHDINRPRAGFGSNRFKREKSLRMDQLEAELEAEFDRLQLPSHDGEFFANYSQQQYPEVDMEDSAPEFSEEVGDQLHETSNDFCGVSPRDLERKLYGILEERQQERIRELESALDYAMQLLEEKESELSGWRDTACLVSQHLPFIPSLLRQVKQAMEAEFEVKEMGKNLINKSIYDCNIQAI